MVEGGEDKRFWQIALDRLKQNAEQLPEHLQTLLGQIEIDTAATSFVHIPGFAGNRAQVEEICRMADADHRKPVVVGFSDREFRDFVDNGTSIADPIAGQKEQPFLLWSRGHSVQNYFFAEESLRPKLLEAATLMNSPNPNESLNRFIAGLDELMIVSASLSRFGMSYSLDMVKGKLRSDFFDWSGGGIVFDVTAWAADIAGQGTFAGKSSVDCENELNACFNVVRASNADVSRWYAHGHMTDRVLWEAFKPCCSTDPADHAQAQTFKEKIRLLGYATAWVGALVIADYQDTPLKCLDLLHSKRQQKDALTTPAAAPPHAAPPAPLGATVATSATTDASTDGDSTA